MRRGAFLLVLAVLAALSMFVGGCGDDGEDGTASLTKAQFVKQANAVCKEVQVERGKALKDLSQNIKPGEKVQTDAFREDLVLNLLVPNYSKQVEGLKKLGAPEGEEEKVEGIIEGMELAVKRIEDNPLPAFYNVVQFKEANERSAAYGLENCVV